MGVENIRVTNTEYNSSYLWPNFLYVEIAISKNNIPIRLTSERWQHITIGHPEIADCYYEILETIENPDIIYEGNNDAKIAKKQFKEIFPKFIVTIYKETSEQDGFIITAYLSTRKQEFEKKKILWKQQH